MFGVSIPELLIVLAIVLIALGPERLPGAARAVGKFLAFFRKNSDAVRKEVYNALYAPAEDVTRELRESARELQAVKADLLKNLEATNPEMLTCEDREKLAELRAKEEEEASATQDDLSDGEAPT